MQVLRKPSVSAHFPHPAHRPPPRRNHMRVHDRGDSVRLCAFEDGAAGPLPVRQDGLLQQQGWKTHNYDDYNYDDPQIERGWRL